MISVKKFSLGKSLSSMLVGVLIFAVSQICGTGYQVIQWVFAGRQVGLDLPVPWHLQTYAFLVAVVLTIICFFKIFRDKYQRTILILTLLASFFIMIPMGWLFLTSHGHLDDMMYRLFDFPNTLKEANTWVKEEDVIQIPTDYGQYKYRFYWDRKKSEYVYEVWQDQNILFSQRIYDFSRRCIRSEPNRCTFVTVPYTPVDILTIEADYQKSIITSSSQVKDVNGDGVLDLVIHEYSGNGNLSQYRIFSLGKELKSTVVPAPEPR